MTSRFEIEQQLRAAYQTLFPVPIGKMKKHEVKHALDVITKAREAHAATPMPAPMPARGTAGPRKISVADVDSGEAKISVPQAPKKTVTERSGKEAEAYREAVGAKPKRLPDTGRKKTPSALAAEVAAAMAGPDRHPLFPGVASHAAASKSAVVEEDVDPKAAKIVKAHGTSSAASLSKEVTPSGGAGDATPVPAPKRRGRQKKPLDPATAEMVAAFQEFMALKAGQKKDQ